MPSRLSSVRPLYGFLSITRFDAQTGFLTAGTLTTVFYAALAVLAVLMLAGSFLQKKQLRFSIFNSRLLAVLAMVLGGVLVLCGVFDLLNIGYAILDSLHFLPAALLSGVLLSGAQAVMEMASVIRLCPAWGILPAGKDCQPQLDHLHLPGHLGAACLCRDVPRLPADCRYARTHPLSAVPAVLHPLPDGTQPHPGRCGFCQGHLLDQRLRLLRRTVRSDDDGWERCCAFPA